MAYEAGTYLIIAVGGGGNGGNGSSSGTNVYCGGEGGSGGLAVSRYSVTPTQLSSYKAVDRRFLRWRSTAAGAIYIYVTDTGQSTGVRTMTAAVGSNGATSTSGGVGNGGAGGLGSGGNVANFRGAGGMGGIRTNGSGNIGSVGNGGIDGTRQDGTGNYNDYMGKRFNVDPNGWNYPRFNGRYFHHQATGVFLPHNWLPNSIGGNFTVDMGGGVGGGGGASDGWYDRNQGYGGPGAVIIIKES